MTFCSPFFSLKKKKEAKSLILKFKYLASAYPRKVSLYLILVKSFTQIVGRSYCLFLLAGIYKFGVLTNYVITFNLKIVGLEDEITNPIRYIIPWDIPPYQMTPSN